MLEYNLDAIVAILDVAQLRAVRKPMQRTDAKTRAVPNSDLPVAGHTITQLQTGRNSTRPEIYRRRPVRRQPKS